MKPRAFLTLFLSMALCACSCAGGKGRVAETAKATEATGEHPGATALMPRHATGFEVEARDGYTLLTLHDPQEPSGETTRFALVPRGTPPLTTSGPLPVTSPAIPDDCTIIETPVRSVVCMTSLQLSNFIALGRTDAVVGVTSTRHLFNPRIQKQISTDKTQKIGIEGNFDPEVIMALDPDLIIVSPYKRGGYDALRETGVPLFPHFGYKETSPLGQAEWIECVGELLGCRADADSLFAGIERRYDALCALTVEATQRPSVLSGEMRGGNWYAVGGESYLAQLFRDAGADYFLADDPRSGGVVMDFEQVYSRASDVRYWRVLNSFDGEFSYDALRMQDARYADFRAWKERGIVYCNMSEVPFYENTPVEPDVVLADFIKVFHPELIPDHEPVYYRLLRGCFEFANLGLSDSESVLFSPGSLATGTPVSPSPREKIPRPEPQIPSVAKFKQPLK